MAVYSAQAHKSIMNAIDGCGGLNIGNGAPELVTGGRDGTCLARGDALHTYFYG